MRSFFAFFGLLLFIIVAKGQNNCSNATFLCANSVVSATTQSATSDVSDPPLSCGDLTVNNSVWFTFTAFSNGMAKISVTNIDNNPGLEMEAYTGACGSLVTTGSCNSANGPAGSMNITFAVTAGTTYYVMVDGASGNQEAFRITASSTTNSVIGRPFSIFNTNPISGCAPLNVLLQNNSIINGGTNITYQWRINSGPALPSSGNDTTVTFNVIGSDTIQLTVCNTECGCNNSTNTVDVVQLSSSMIIPPNICPGVLVDFSGQAIYVPTGDSANIVDWEWNFGDPASGPNDSASGQYVQHAFIGAGPTFTVTLIVTSADCGTDTVTTLVTINPKPTVNAGADQIICEGADANLTAVTSNAVSPISYQWTGVGFFSCDTCQSTTVSTLPAGGPYNISIHIQDGNGCTADSSVNISVNPKPVVDVGNDTMVCRYSPAQLNANVTTGNPPFTYLWSPSSGLNNNTIQNPIATVAASTNYCVVVQDSIGCTSDPACVNVNVFPPPSINTAPSTLCASDPNLHATFSVTGAGPGSTYSWTMSPNYSLIDSSSVDSSIIRVTFPPNIAATYNFICVVVDGVTGCTDTVPISYVIVSGLNMTLTPSTKICQGDATTLVATGALVYAWTASPSYAFPDSTLATQVVSPTVTTVYTVRGTIGTCSQVLKDTITVNSRPSVTLSSDSTICPNSPTQIFSNVSGGTPPFNYAWTPSTGLNNPNIQNPTATITSSTTYCAFVRDSNSCVSDTPCVNLTVYPTLSVSQSPTSLCATDTSMKSVFTVNGAGPGSSYQWYLSPDYSLITASNVDSSSVTATFPQGLVATYQFVVVVIDAATGCHDTIPLSFTVVSGLNMTVTGNNKICNGQSTTLTANGATTYTWTASPSYTFSNPNSAMQTVSPSTTTTFTVTGTTGTCNQAIAYTVTVGAKPSAVVSPIPLFCGCDTVLLDGSLSTSGLTYNWTSSGGNTIYFPNLQSAATYICTPDSFTLIVTDPSTGCADTASATAGQKPKPAATAVVTPTLFCSGTSTTVLLDGSGSDTNPGTTYSWTSNNPGTTFADSTALITTATISSATIFTLTVSDSIGCDSTVTVTVNTYPLLTVNAGPDQTICEGADAILTAVTVNGTPPITYQWTSGVGFFSCDVCQSTNLTGLLASGPYNINIFVTDSNGCTADSSVNITVNTGPTVTVNNDTTVCRNSTVQLNATATGTSPFTYSWSPSIGLSDSTIQNPIATVTGPVSYCVVVNDSAGCSSNTTCISLDIYPSPVINAVPGALCYSDPNLKAIFTVTGAGINSIYHWYLSPDFSLIDSASTDSSVTRVTFPTGIAATYNFICIVTDGVTGCTDTISTSFNVVSGLNMTVIGPTKMCLGDSIILTAQGANNYTWSASPAYTFANPNDSTQTVSPVVTTIFTIQGNIGSCSQVITDTLTVSPKPDAFASPIPPFCGCANVNLDGTGSTPGMVYNWLSTAGNTIINPNQLNATSNICSSDVFVLVVIDTASGCADSASTIAAQSGKPDAVVLITPNQVCDSTSTVVTLDGTGSDTNFGTTYHWTSSPVVPITDTTAITTTATVTTQTVFYLTVTNAAGCDSIVIDTLDIYPTPSIAAFNPFMCASDPVLQSNIVISGASPGSTYVWDSIPPCVVPNSANTSSQLFDFTSCGAGTYWFYVTVTDFATGCIKQVRQPVSVITGVALSTTGDVAICEGDSVILTAGGANSYLWSPGNFTTSSITLTGLTAGTYSVSVTGTVGTCVATDSMTITVNSVPVTSPISGPTTVCADDSGLIYYVTPPSANYTWTVSNGTILQGQNTDSIYVQWDSTAAIGTITVIDTNAFGCAGNMQTLNITINPRPTTSPITGPDPVCDSTMATYFVTPHSGSTYNWAVQGGSIIGSNNTNIINVLWDTTGVGYLIVYETNAVGCSSDTVQDTIVVFPNPVTPDIQGNDTLCEGALMEMYTVTFTPGSAYTWTTTGTIVSGQGMDTIYVDWPVPGNHIITVFETNTNGCISSADTLNILVDTIPVATASPSFDTLCSNIPFQITGTVNINGSITWTHTSTGSFNDSTITSPIYSPGLVGTDTLMMVLSSPRCGSDTAYVFLTTIPSPVITLTSSPNDSICFGLTDTLIATGGGTYLWSNGATTDTIIVTPSVTGTYTVTVTNAFNCASTDSISITVIPLPPDTISGPAIVCGSDSVNYFVNLSTGNHTWSILNGIILSGQNTDTINVKWDSIPGVDTVFLTTVNSFGCLSTDTLFVNVNSLPLTIPINWDDSVCVSDTVIYAVTNNPGSTYSWVITGSATDTILGNSTSDSIVVLWTGPGTGYISLTETNAAGCSTTVYDTISVFAIPGTPIILGAPRICEGDTMELYHSIPFSPNATYNWSISADTVFSGQGTDTIHVNWTIPGQQIIAVTQTEFGCTSPVARDTIMVDTLPRATVSPDTISQCRNIPLPVTGTSNISNGTVLWTTSGNGTFDNDTILAPVYTPDTSDTGTVILSMVLTSPNCGSDTQRVVLQLIAAPIYTVTAIPSDTLCFGDSTLLKVNSALPYTYLWSTGDTTDSVSVKPLVTTTYTLIVNNANNCADTTTVLIVVIPPGTANAGPDTVICHNDSILLHGTYANAGGLMWTTLGDGTFTNDIADSTWYTRGPTDTANGSVTIVLSATGACLNLTDTLFILFGTMPSANAGPDTTIVGDPNSTVVLPVNGSQTSGTTWHWTTSGTGTFSDDSSLTGTYTPSPADFIGDSVIITLTVTGPCGTAVDYFVIDFTPFKVPNVFTPYPNTPGYNDFFVIFNLPPGSKLQVWDRWGLLVYTSDNYQNNWDAHGSDAGVFYYILETTRKKYHGWVQVIR